LAGAKDQELTPIFSLLRLHRLNAPDTHNAFGQKPATSIRPFEWIGLQIWIAWVKPRQVFGEKLARAWAGLPGGTDQPSGDGSQESEVGVSARSRTVPISLLFNL
jgi:hypothetical protein